MTTRMKDLERQAQQLSPEEREMLAQRLLAQLGSLSLGEVEEAWIEEAERRYEAWKAGRTEGLNAKDVIESIRKEIAP